MDGSRQIGQHLDALAGRIESRSSVILEAWRRAVEGDSRLTSISSVSRAQFYDHIPSVLASFVRTLRAHGESAESRAAARQKESASEHGLVRWQQGFGLYEVMLEWRHLHLALLDEFEREAGNHPELDEGAMLFARRALGELCNDGVCESADQYVRLQQVDAAGRVDDLEQALARLDELERARSEVWREAAHDLRGNLGVVKNATELLNFPEVPEPTRLKSLDILQKSVTSLQALLSDMTSLARLEAGREMRSLESFDAADLLLQVSADFQAMADKHGLFLKTGGPASLPVQGDAVKVRRIAQNLVMNALQYTGRGGVNLTWGEDVAERWFLCVQDSGPGLQHGRVVPLAHEIKQATDEVRDMERLAQLDDRAAQPQVRMPPPMVSGVASRGETDGAVHSGRPAGEGIGLSIIKRLCELLEASIELQTAPGQGSTFRISLPRAYAS
ncbi:MAG: histidine kinase [Betaproteobacteria bacterium]|nr:histidine kinase [Betaproteobacteria bacterium]